MEGKNYKQVLELFKQLDTIECEMLQIKSWATEAVAKETDFALTINRAATDSTNMDRIRSFDFPRLSSLLGGGMYGSGIEYGTREASERASSKELNLTIPSSLGLHIADVLLADKVIRREQIHAQLKEYGITI